MKIRLFRSETALKLGAFLAVASASALLILPGCSGGSGGFEGSPTATPVPTETQNFAGTVNLDNGQRGTLALRAFNNGTARGTFTVSNAVVIAGTRKAQAIPTLTIGVYNVSGSVNTTTGRIQLSGNITGFGAFSINVTPPDAINTGSFVVNFNGQEFTGSIPATIPTATPTTPTATPITNPTTAPAGQVPVGHGPLTITLTSSNNTLSGGGITTSTGATAVVDKLGDSTRINMVNGTNSLPPRLFNFLIAKTGVIKTGDTLTVVGDTASNDVVTFTVTNLTNPANSGVYRGQSGSLKISSVVGKKVSFTISNLRMVSQTSSASFTFNGSGSFTIE